MIAWTISLGILMGCLISGDHSLLMPSAIFAVAGAISMAKFAK
jgi:hypothetical protein